MKSAVKAVRTKARDLDRYELAVADHGLFCYILIFDHDFPWNVKLTPTKSVENIEVEIIRIYWATLNWKHAFIVLQWFNSYQKDYL